MKAYDVITDIYNGRAQRRYGLTAVTQLQHALQAACLAEEQGETKEFIVAALLHDIGHMVHDLGEAPAEHGVDDTHEERGANWLRQYFSPEVTEPVRLHVPAKRYLCACEPAYAQSLAPESVRSLALQGGPMSRAEISDFLALPYAREAVRLRRLDDKAKDGQATTPPLAYFMSYVQLVQLRAVTG